MAPSTVNLTELCSRYVGMQLAGDRRAALRFIDEALVAGVSVADLSTHVVAAAQREIGANVPLGSLLRMLDEERTDLLGLPVTMLFNLQSLRDTVRAVRSEDRRRRLPIAVGGHAVREMASPGEDLGVDLVVANTDDGVAQIDELLGAPP